MNKKKIARYLIMTFLISIFTVGCGEKEENRNSDNQTRFDEEVSVSDEISKPENRKDTLQIDEDGTYVFYVNITPDHEGLLTGCKLYDEDRNILFAATGEEMKAESRKLDLREGAYTVECVYLNNENSWKDFFEEAGKVFPIKDSEGNPADYEYEFSDSGSWKIDVEYGTYTASHGLEYLMGVVCGVIAGILLLALLAWVIRKMGGKVDLGWWKCHEKNSYDERQVIARGQAYKTAFFILICYIVAVSWINEMFEMPLFMSFCGLWIGVCLSILVFAVICIWKDAYMSLYENAKGVIILLAVMGGVNIGIGILNIARGNPVLENGALSVVCVNMVVGILVVLVLAAFVARLVCNTRNIDKEEEE